MSKEQMVRALRQIGAHERANELEAYRDENGRNWGWNGWFNKRR